jgi:hypothetical protein
MLFHLGAAAVLAMQGPVPGAAAAYLSAAMYETLTAGRPLDLALTDARQRLSAQPGLGTAWAIPALHLRTPVEHVLPSPRPVPEELLQAAHLAVEFKHNSLFVARRDQRDSLFERVRTDGLIVVHGGRRTSKSGLVRYCLECLTCWGHPTKYLDLLNAQVNPLDLLRLIRDGNPATLLGRPLPVQAFTRFNRTVNALLDGADPDGPGVLERYPDVDQMHRLGAAQNTGIEGLIARLFETFVTSLREAAASVTDAEGRRLVLVLDHVTALVGGGLQAEVYKLVLRRLIVPFAQEAIPNAVLILVTDESEYGMVDETLAEVRLNASKMTVDMPLFRGSDFVAVTGEFCRRLGIERAVWEPVVQLLATARGLQYQQTWSPGYLDKVRGVLT